MEVKALAPTIVTDDTRRPSHVSLETVVFPPLVPFDALLGLSKGQCAFCLTEYIVNSSDEDTKNINVGDSTALPARKNVKKAGASASPALPSDSWIGIIPCCQHRFHFKCISEWAARENRCPWCKLRFRAIGVYDRAGRRVCYRYARTHDQVSPEHFDERGVLRVVEQELSDPGECRNPCFVCQGAGRQPASSSASTSADGKPARSKDLFCVI